jgi:hypothetical protein
MEQLRVRDALKKTGNGIMNLSLLRFLHKGVDTKNGNLDVCTQRYHTQRK